VNVIAKLNQNITPNLNYEVKLNDTHIHKTISITIGDSDTHLHWISNR